MLWKHFPNYWLHVRGTTGHQWIPLTKGPVMWRFDVFCAVSLNKLLNKQSCCQWFEMPWHVIVMNSLPLTWSLRFFQDLGVPRGSSQCPVCKKSFVFMRKHFREVHLGEKRYDCSICGKKFSQKSNLNRHVKGIHEMTSPGGSSGAGNQNFGGMPSGGPVFPEQFSPRTIQPK